MSIDISRLHRVLKDATRSRILESLGQEGPLTYVQIQDLCQIAHTGTLNYHLKILADLIRKNEQTGRYELTEKGKIATELVGKFTEPKSSGNVLDSNGTNLGTLLLGALRTPKTWRYFWYLLVVGLSPYIISQIALYLPYGQGSQIFGFSFSPLLATRMWIEIGILCIGVYLSFRPIPKSPPVKTVAFVLVSTGLYFLMWGMFPTVGYLLHPNSTYTLFDPVSGQLVTFNYTLFDAIRSSDTGFVLISFISFAAAVYLLTKRSLLSTVQGNTSHATIDSPNRRN